MGGGRSEGPHPILIRAGNREMFFTVAKSRKLYFKKVRFEVTRATGVIVVLARKLIMLMTGVGTLPPDSPGKLL